MKRPEPTMDLSALESRLLELSQDEPITHAALRVAREVYGNKDKLSRYAFAAMCLAERVLEQNKKLEELVRNQPLPPFKVESDYTVLSLNDGLHDIPKCGGIHKIVNLEGTKTGRIQCEVPNQASEPKRSCNRHDDCDAADAKAKQYGFHEGHCHDDCCEDCLGK